MYTHTSGSPLKWGLQNSNTVPSGSRAKDLRGAAKTEVKEWREEESGELVGSHFGVLSPAHQVQPLALPQQTSKTTQSKLKVAMGNHHPDAGLGQDSVSAWAVQGSPGGQQWGPQGAAVHWTWLWSLPSRLLAPLIPEDHTALGLRAGSLATRTQWSQRPRSHSGLGHKARNAPRGLRTCRASPMAVRRPAGPMPMLARGPGPEDGKGSQGVGGSHTN